MVTAKIKNLSGLNGSETSSSNGKPLFWVNHLCKVTTVTAKMKNNGG